MTKRKRFDLRIPRLICGMCFVLGVLASGCGALESPVLQRATDAPVATQVEESLPTEAPTDTPAPATATPPPEPTATPSPQPTATSEPTATPILSPIDRMVAARNPENGKILFETFQEEAGSGYSCSNCHLADSEKTNLGPGLLNIRQRAATRVEGQSAAEYIYESIVDTEAYSVEGFDPELMPWNWARIYSDLEIFDIVAYLLTLEGRSDIDDPDPVSEEAASDSD